MGCRVADRARRVPLARGGGERRHVHVGNGPFRRRRPELDFAPELHRSQEQLVGRVAPRLSDVLAPVVSLLTTKTITTKLDDGVTEVKQNYFCTALEDPDYVQQCYVILARNAVSLRHVVLANFDKLLLAVRDYLEATHKDSQHDARGFVY